VTVDLKGDGPWLPGSQDAQPATETLSGTVTVHNANWKADYLANAVEIAEATLHVENGETRWDAVDFSYGPVKGTASLTVPAHCETPCVPSFEVQFGELDASALQAAILGAHEKGTLLSELIARLKPSTAAPAWPQMEGTVKADALVLGPVTLHDATATLRVGTTGAEIAGLDASLLGGHVHGAGTLRAAGTGQDKPAYTLEGQFEKLSPAEVGELAGLRWSGGVFDAQGKIELTGFTDKDLSASVHGTLHFDWRHGVVSGQAEEVPAALAHFDRWSADAEIAHGKIALKQSQAQRGGVKRGVDGALAFGDPPKVGFAASRVTQAKR
jgi:hypothetical protein